MKLNEVFGKKMTDEEFMNACDEKARKFTGKVSEVVNLGNHDYNTIKGFFKFGGKTLRVNRNGVFRLNDEVIDLASIPYKPGRIYLVSKICAAYAQRDDFVFVVNGMQMGKNRFLFSF